MAAGCAELAWAAIVLPPRAPDHQLVGNQGTLALPKTLVVNNVLLGARGNTGSGWLPPDRREALAILFFDYEGG